MTFRISALPAENFVTLATLDGPALARHGAIRQVADHAPGFPCRVSLRDAAIGETVLLVHYEHQPVASPFRASHAIYVRENAAQAMPAAGEVPAMLRSRILSLRGFNAAGMMLAADLAEGAALEPALLAMLADPAIDYIHLHFAKPGCYAARVDRTTTQPDQTFDPLP